MELLDSPIRAYPWGSRTVLAALAGRPAPTAQPEAELWMGAHPDSPSRLVATGMTLTDAVAADPERLLGSDVAHRFGPRLPFMLKVLAADAPLSLQAHPDAATAARRYAAESGLSAAERNYTDPYAKPELLVAVAPMEVLCGFRPPALAADDLASLGVGALKPVIDALRGPEEATALRSAVHTLLHWPVPERAGLVAEVAAAARTTGFAHIADLAERYPADLGVPVAMLLNHVHLDIDQAVFLPAGNLHAYLRGTGMEVLAASDNVLRGGLTGKRVDVGELLDILRFEVLSDPVLRPEALGPAIRTWPVPVPEFALLKITGPADLAAGGPRIVFCLSGSVRLDDGSALDLTAGRAAFGAAGRPLRVRGTGVVFVASTGR